MQEDPYALGWWEPLAGTSAAGEQARVDAGEPWAVAALAGLQYHAWQQDDGMDGRHEPQPGDRLQLVREPANPYDGNAVRVEWRNGVMLGHLARDLAADVAAALDLGTSLRAYVLATKNGEDDGTYYARRFDRRAWSLCVLLVGHPVAGRYGEWTTGVALRAEAETWGAPAQYWDSQRKRPIQGPERRVPTERQERAAKAWEARLRLARVRAEADAAAAFATLDEERLPLPEGAGIAPDPSMRGKVYAWWDEVPPCLMTGTGLAKHGLRPVGEPFAHIEYSARRHWRRYGLHAVTEARPVRPRTAEQRAAAAALAVVLRASRERWENSALDL